MNHTFDMSKKILVPTDFSENAYLAAEFACKLALEKKFIIHLYHFYTSSSIIFEDDEEDQDENKAHIIKADLMIVELKEKLAFSFPELVIESTCDRGLLLEKLPIIANHDDYKLIVMGTTGTSEKKSIQYGSNTSAITAKSPIPVIAIPAHKGEFVLKRIGLLTNFRPEEIETLIEYINLLNQIDELYLIHVYKEDEVESEIKDRLESWAYNIKELDGIDKVTTLFDHITKEDEDLDSISEVVNAFVEKSNIDLLLVTKTRKSFFNRIFKPSVSQKIALDLKVPAFFDQIN